MSILVKKKKIPITHLHRRKCQIIHPCQNFKLLPPADTKQQPSTGTLIHNAELTFGSRVKLA